MILGAAFLLLCIVGGAWYLLDRLRPEKAGRALSNALFQSLGMSPAVIVRDWVVVEEKKPVFELALVARDADVSRRIESVRLRSKAELSLRAAFRVKAGFDLRDPETSVALDPRLREASFSLPYPRVLSVEMIRYEVLADRDGWWSRITEEEKSQAMRDMQTEARAEAMRAGILRECERRLDEELAGVSRRTGIAVTANYRLPEAAEPAPVPKP